LFSYFCTFPEFFMFFSHAPMGILGNRPWPPLEKGQNRGGEGTFLGSFLCVFSSGLSFSLSLSRVSSGIKGKYGLRPMLPSAESSFLFPHSLSLPLSPSLSLSLPLSPSLSPPKREKKSSGKRMDQKHVHFPPSLFLNLCNLFVSFLPSTPQPRPLPFFAPAQIPKEKTSMS